MKLNVYLSFPGTCDEAFAFYQGILGGEITMKMPYGGSPMEDQVPADWKDKVMHVSMEVGGMELMGSDMAAENYVTPQGYNVAIQIDDPVEAERIFGALLEGGQAIMPMDQTFWAKRFGMLVDRFGIHWLVNCD